MKDTYTPLEIDGKIMVVVNAPDKPDRSIYDDPSMPHTSDEMKDEAYSIDIDEYWLQIGIREKLPTLPSDEPYWRGKIGVRMEGHEFSTINYVWHEGHYISACDVCKTPFWNGAKRQKTCEECCKPTYAAPPMTIPKKQDNGDLWDEAEKLAEEYANTEHSVDTSSAICWTGSFINDWYIAKMYYLKTHYSLTKK